MVVTLLVGTFFNDGHTVTRHQQVRFGRKYEDCFSFLPSGLA